MPYLILFPPTTGVQNHSFRRVGTRRQAPLHSALPLPQDLRRHVLPSQRKDERQEQASCASSRRNQRVATAGGRKDQRIPERVPTGVREKVGRLAQHLHSRLWRPLQRALLLNADDGGRAHSQTHLWLYRHHPEEKEGQGVRTR